ncbi:MAG TPA: hypothetical protein PK995_07965 [Bacteroidia bacterium]|nr:hypothetical protein [Bacteroidia bacterium]
MNKEKSKKYVLLLLSIVLSISCLSQNKSREEKINDLRKNFKGLSFIADTIDYLSMRRDLRNLILKKYGEKFLDFYDKYYLEKYLYKIKINDLEKQCIVENIAYYWILTVLEAKHKDFGEGYFVEYTYTYLEDMHSFLYYPRYYLFVFKDTIVENKCCEYELKKDAFEKLIEKFENVLSSFWEIIKDLNHFDEGQMYLSLIDEFLTKYSHIRKNKWYIEQDIKKWVKEQETKREKEDTTKGTNRDEKYKKK